MTTGGRFNVSSGGAFTYAIPIATPPGTAGVAPSLSLFYSSQNGDGYEGLGWALTGLSRLTRCPRTQTADAAHGGVNFDANDRFCLDGQELMAISGIYGADGTEYRTFNNTLTQIISHGSAGSGPAYFTAITKSGLAVEYGHTSGSQFQPLKADGSGVASSVSVWAVDKVTDRSGNYFTVSYIDDVTNGQIYPQHVDYTGNGALSPYNSVHFTYMDRGFPIPVYQAGTVTTATKLLTHVQTFTGTTMVSDYRLSYNFASSGAGHDELTSITRCDGAGACLASTSFTWQGSGSQLTLNSTANSLASGLALFAGDYNADGLTDAVAVDPSCPAGGVVWSGSNTSGFSRAGLTASYVYWQMNNSQSQNYNGPACFLGGTAVAGDFSGDGFSDVLLNETYWNFVDGSWEPNNFTNALLNNKAGSLGETVVNRSLPTFAVLGDFDGDGRMDGLAQISTASGTPYLSNGDGTFKTGTVLNGLGVGTVLAAGDFDGDGCTDLLAQGATNAITYFCSPAVASAAAPNFQGNVVTGDFNGDGKTDVLLVGTTGATLYLSTGTGLSAGIAVAGSATWHNFQVLAGDFNGDGKADLALISHTPGTPHQFYLATGTGFTQALNASGSPVTIVNTNTSVKGTVADWNNDGADDVWLQKASGDSIATFAYTPDMITQAANSIGASVVVHYDRLNENGTFYAKGTAATYPVRDLDGAFYVVSEIDTSDGIGGSRAQTYAYSGAIADVTAAPKALPRGNLAASGFLAFSQVTTTNVSTGVVQTTSYHTDVPYVGLTSAQTLVSGAVTLLNRTFGYTSSDGGGGSNVVSIVGTTTARTDLDGSVWPSTTTVVASDAYANPIRHTTSWTDGSSQEIDSTFNNDTVHWVLGQTLTTTVTSGTNSSSLVRHYSFAYDPVTTKMNLEQQEQGNSALELDASYTFDAFGNAVSTRLSGAGVSARTTTAAYDAAGEFPITTTNALTQSDSWTYNASFGAPATHTDPNGLATTWNYDTFGRPSLVTGPDGNETAYGYAYCAGVNGGTVACATLGAIQMTVTPQNAAGVQNGAATIVTYDSLGRVIAQDTQGFDGSWIRQAKQYDSNYHLAKVSRPYFLANGSGTPYWTTYAYDVLSRVVSITAPDQSMTTYAYHAATTTTTDPLQHTTSVTRNAHDHIASVTDANGKMTSLGYDFFDNLTTVTDPAGSTSTSTYDIRGRKTAISDPDMGNWSYGYDVFSELTSQVDAKNQTTTFSYDRLGRMTGRTASDQTSTWSYDGGPGGIGRLTHACNAATCAAATDQRSPSYSSIGQTNAMNYRIDGANYVYNANYNSDGRLSALTYPSGFRADYDYNSYGYLADIKDHATHAAIWTANAANAELHLTQATAGNGVTTYDSYDHQTGRLLNVCATPNSGTCDGATENLSFAWDADGELSARSDTIEGTTESFCYDALNRLTQSSFGSLCTSNPHKLINYAVSGNGDITRKSDICNTSGCMTYGGTAGPHALTAIAGAVNGIVNPTFTYDGDGNMTSGLGRNMSWTSFNMASAITQGTTNIGFLYDADHQRYKQCTGGCTAPTTTRIYMNNMFDGAGSEKSTTGTSVTWSDYIVAGGHIVAERFNVIGVISTRYFVGDHEGSTSVLTDESQRVSERNSYDSWGKRRHADGTDDPSCSQVSQSTRGYTGHEHLDAVCLINMNARLYDPSIGRFLSADTIVQNPANGQSHNRYSYVNNNPLNATDPTGHELANEDAAINSLIIAIDGSTMDGDDDFGDDGDDGYGDDGDQNGGYSGGGDNGIETVVVDVCRSCLLSGQAGLLSANSAPPSFGNNKEKCDPVLLAMGNSMRSAAHVGNKVSTAVFVWGAAADLDFVPAALVTDGTAEIPGTTMMGGAIAGYNFDAMMDATGRIMQTEATGDPGPENEAAEEYGRDAANVVNLGPVAGGLLDIAQTAFEGAVDAHGDAPTPMMCPQ